MRQRSGARALLPLLAAGFGALLLSEATAPAQGEEIAATHLILEKATKMKRTEASLFIPFLDQSRKSDSSSRPRQLRCSVIADGKSGAVPVRGKIGVELHGEIASSGAIWSSGAIAVQVDDDGNALVDAAGIRSLADQAAATGASNEYFKVDFDGGRGKKVLSLTMDCVHEEGEE